MRRVRPRPRRRWRNELLSLLPVLMLPATLAWFFPWWRDGTEIVAEERRSEPSCLFAELADGVEERAFDIVQSSFSADPERVRALREDLLMAPLPEERATPVLQVADRLPPAPAAAVAYAAMPLPRSLAARDPETLSPLDAPPALPVFPREELLQLD